MRSFVIAVACLVVVGQIAWAAVTSRHEADWMAYKLKHGKSYTSQAEDASRMANFLASKQRVERHNANGDSSFVMGLNHLSDKAPEELAKRNGFKASKQTLLKAKAKAQSRENAAYIAELLASSSAPVPDALDWRNVSGRVSSVKNQGDCGSCWAFSTTGALEGQELLHGLKRDKLVPLSEQELLDCSNSNSGCDGGTMDRAFDDISKIGGVEASKDYPYEANDNGKCRFDKTKVVLTDEGHGFLPQREDVIKDTLAMFGPLPVALEATDNLIHYESGVLDDRECRKNLDHAVLLVGYGTDPKSGDYWIVKNSWGAEWGDAGYFKIKRGVNMCGIATYVPIPKF